MFNFAVVCLYIIFQKSVCTMHAIGWHHQNTTCAHVPVHYMAATPCPWPPAHMHNLAGVQSTDADVSHNRLQRDCGASVIICVISVWIKCIRMHWIIPVYYHNLLTSLLTRVLCKWYAIVFVKENEVNFLCHLSILICWVGLYSWMLSFLILKKVMENEDTLLLQWCMDT